MRSLKCSDYFIVPGEQMGICFHCHEGLDNGEKLVAHEEGGRKHPIHKECMIEIVKKWKEECPFCHAKIDPNSLQSLTERTIRIIKPFIKWASISAIAYMTGAVVVEILSKTGCVFTPPSNEARMIYHKGTLLTGMVFSITMGGIWGCLERSKFFG